MSRTYSNIISATKCRYSLKLTIPIDIVRNLNIQEQDKFQVTSKGSKIIAERL